MNVINQIKPAFIEPHPSWSVVDYSKLSTFVACPRKYFYRYVLGWETDSPNLNLIFGEAWHRCAEALINGDSEDEAKARFLDYYRRFYSEETDADNIPKSPLVLDDAVEVALPHLREAEPVATELSGAVALGDGAELAYRIDAIVKNNLGQIILWDHKTTSWYSSVWANQFVLSLQFGLYIHAAKQLYPDIDVSAMIVKGLILRKNIVEFVNVPVSRTDLGVYSSLHTLEYYYHALLDEFVRLLSDSPDELYMKSFPLNPESCTKYNRLCPYHAYCVAWPNPLSRCDKPPLGMEVKWWNPLTVKDAERNQTGSQSSQSTAQTAADEGISSFVSRAQSL